MGTTRKVAIGLGIAGGAFLAAWLLSGERKKKTRDFILKKANDLRRNIKKQGGVVEDTDAHYV